MSYCRWSTDDFQCNLYCYEDVGGGFTTHIANYITKYYVEIPEDVYLTQETIADGSYMARHNEMNRIREDKNLSELVPIGLVWDGMSFNDPTAAQFYLRLIFCKALGYIFPDYVFEDVREEMGTPLQLGE